MSISNNIHNVAILDAAEMILDFTAEEQVPVDPAPPKGKEDQEKYEKRKVDKKQTIPLKFLSSSYSLAPKTRKGFLELENKISEGDRQILLMKEAKNTLEAYGYDMRQRIDQYGGLEKYVDPATKSLFIRDINEVVDWLYDDASKSATKEQLEQKLFMFRTIGEPIKRRYNYWSEIDVYLMQFEK